MKASEIADALDRLTEKVEAFATATGIDIRQSWPDDFGRFAGLWELARTSRDFAGVAAQLRVTADALEVISNTQQREATG